MVHIMKVPLIDIASSYLEIQEEVRDAMDRVLNRGWLILGPELEAFEAEFAAYVGSRHCVGVGSGLDALRLALTAVGVGPGDEVIVPGNTFIATWLAVSETGARPVPVDPDETTRNITAEAVERAITDRTVAVIPVHLYGLPADMDPIRALTERHCLYLLEDGAQAHGAKYRGRRVGSMGSSVAWSFYPTKNLGAFGDGGAITTDDPAIADKARLLRNYGSRQKYVHDVKGLNSRLDELQAAILRVKLRRLEEWNERRASVARRYTKALGGGPVQAPVIPSWASPSWYAYAVRTKNRGRLQEYLKAREIETIIHYPRSPSRQQAYTDLALDPRSLPVTDALQDEVLSLPIGPNMKANQVEWVIESILGFRAPE